MLLSTGILCIVIHCLRKDTTLRNPPPSPSPSQQELTLSRNYYKRVISSDLLCPVLSLGDCYMCFDWLKAFEVNG